MRVAIIKDGTFTGRTYSGPIVHVPLRDGETWVPLTQEHLVKDVEAVEDMWDYVRREGNRRLSASDWIVTRATERGEPVPAEWVAYRQALRDITGQADPLAIIWPEVPK
jgi:hypothetical protein